MASLRLGWIPFLLAASLSVAGAADQCKLMMFPLPIKMENRRPVISASINGAEARFIVDTGSFFDFLSPAAAAQFKLPQSYAPPWYQVSGVGGSSFVPKIATAKTFTVAGINSHDAQFLVGDNDFGDGIDGILGQNLFRLTDVDYDFANGMLRFVKPQHCGGHMLAYWATTQPYGVVDLQWTSDRQSHVLGTATVNGHSIRVLFDTGSWRTLLSLHAAKRAGITPDSPGVVPAGVSIGLGDRPVKVWVAPIASFEIGGETIKNTHVLIGDIGLQGADMLLGSDFFLAHHIYVAYSQDKLYFTYNGGPVFDLNTQAPAPPKAPAGNTPAASDAAELMRHGMAESSRGELAQAITDFTRACELQPADADCAYQRGLAYWHSAQPQAALADFSAAIQRRPDYFEAYLARAQLEMAKQPAGAESDLDAVDRFAPQRADQRLQLARLYDAAGEYAGAVHQYDLWIDYHPNDVRRPAALSGRCGSEAAANVDVDRAVDDCNTALRLARDAHMNELSAFTLSNRGVAYLRQNQLDSALADSQAALKLLPQFSLARYELGLVELKKGLTPQGQADLAAALARRPGLAKRLASMGLKP